MDNKRAVEILDKEIEEYLPEEKKKEYKLAVRKIFKLLDFMTEHFIEEQKAYLKKCDTCGAMNEPKKDKIVHIEKKKGKGYYSYFMQCRNCGCDIYLGAAHLTDKEKMVHNKEKWRAHNGH